MITYRTVQGDTWSGIAFKLFGDETLMTLLLNANPSLARITVFGGGVALNVPDKPEQTANDLPPWKREG